MDLIQSLRVHLPKLFPKKMFVHSEQLVGIKFKGLPFIPYVCNLNINPSYQTLSKALEMSKKVPLTSSGGLQSNDL